MGSTLPGPASARVRAADFPPAGSRLKAARRAPHVRRQHQRGLQLHSPGSRFALRRGCPRRWATRPALAVPGARGPPVSLAGHCSPGPVPPLHAGPLACTLPRCPRGTPLPRDLRSLGFRGRWRYARKTVRGAAQRGAAGAEASSRSLQLRWPPLGAATLESVAGTVRTTAGLPSPLAPLCLCSPPGPSPI